MNAVSARGAYVANGRQTRRRASPQMQHGLRGEERADAKDHKTAPLHSRVEDCPPLQIHKKRHRKDLI